MADPLRGEIWVTDFDPVRGHEQGGRRPALVISVDAFNLGPARLVMVLPLSTRPKRASSHVLVEPPEGGLNQRSYIRCEDIRSISHERLIERWGRVTETTLYATEMRLRILIGLQS